MRRTRGRSWGHGERADHREDHREGHREDIHGDLGSRGVVFTRWPEGLIDVGEGV